MASQTTLLEVDSTAHSPSRTLRIRLMDECEWHIVPFRVLPC